ncbi:hypothetical protein K439DRAFT_97921 [Ramaria rubella]|nr:hypothetical protein K439DRAFT_97921 [Ramaria rubella]
MSGDSSPPPPASRVGFREIFEIRKINNSSLRSNPTCRDAGLPGAITCTMPFVLANGRSFVAIGCPGGIWVVDSNDPDFMHRVMDVKGVTGLFVIEQYGMLLVLASKVLYCYSLDALDPYNRDVRIPQRIASAGPIDLFRVGIWSNSLVIIYKIKRLMESVFHIIEPIIGEPPAYSTTDSIVANMGPGRVYHFRPLKEFYVPVDCTDIVFLKSTLALLHPLGFEILDLETLTSATIPPKDDIRSKALVKRCKSSKPLGLFRGKEGKHLLCYSTFGLFVDRHGDPLHDYEHLIDWHGTVYAVAPVAPYIVLFKARSIEVRRGDTGALEQVLFGNGMRCSWRGPGVLQGELGEDDLEPGLAHTRSRMQVVMNAPHGMGSEEVAQHVYDLVLKSG